MPNVVDTVRNIWAIEDLRKRVLFTFALLAVYRLGSHIPTPGVDPVALSEFFKAMSGGVFGFLDLFSGGALRRLSVFALGIMPYISASIILQFLTVVWPYLEKLSKEGEMGRRKINQYTRYGTIVLSIVQSLGVAFWLKSQTSPGGAPLVPRHVQDSLWGIGFPIMTVLTLTTGTAFIMWLGEQISERGIGNGISLIIFAGIVVGLPSAVLDDHRRHPGRRARHLRHALPGDLHGRRDGVRRVHGTRTTAHPRAIREARRRPQGLRRVEYLPAAAREHRRRHPGHLRFVDPGHPPDDRRR